MAHAALRAPRAAAAGEVVSKKPKVFGQRVELLVARDAEPMLAHADAITGVSPAENDQAQVLLDTGHEIRVMHTYKEVKAALLEADGYEEDEEG